jgi:hypothetical protein
MPVSCAKPLSPAAARSAKMDRWELALLQEGLLLAAEEIAVSTLHSGAVR